MPKPKGPGVVVVGTGFGCLTHIPALRAAGFDVAALVGQDLRKTKLRARRLKVPKALTSLEAALALPGVEAVTIATPPHTHARLVLAAVDAGKHVLCEKPFARDAVEARAMLRAATAAGVVHLVGTEFRWGTGQALMSRAVRQGAIGEPRLATFLLHIPLLADPEAEVPAWWGRADAGGGWLGAHAAHVVDQVRGLFGDLEGVSAALPRLVDRGWTAEDAYSIRFRTRSGVDGIIQAAAADWGPLLIVSRVAGTTGAIWAEGDTVTVGGPRGPKVLPVPEDLQPLPVQPPPSDLLTTAYDLLHSTGIDLGPYTRLATCFADLIAGRPVPDDPAPATFADGLAVMAVLDAVRRSAADGGRWTDVART